MFLFQIPDDLSWRVARIPKKTPGRFRTLHIPNDALKAEQQRILHEYIDKNKALKPANVACGFVPYRNTSTGLLRHEKSAKVVLKMDMKDFFDTFPPELTWSRMLKVGVAASTVDTLKKLCLYDGKLFGQGAPTSPAMTNIGMYEIDLKLASFAKKHGFTYSRYADDMAFCLTEKGAEKLTKREENLNKHTKPGEPRKRYYFAWFFRGVEILLNAHGLKVNPRKSEVIRHNSPCKSRRITGIVMRNDDLGYNAPRRFRRRARAMCHNLYVAFKDNPARKPTPEEYTQWARLYGCVCYMDHKRSYSLPEVAGADPVISEKEWNLLLGIFKKGGVIDARSA